RLCRAECDARGEIPGARGAQDEAEDRADLAQINRMAYEPVRAMCDKPSRLREEAEAPSESPDRGDEPDVADECDEVAHQDECRVVRGGRLPEDDDRRERNETRDECDRVP